MDGIIVIFFIAAAIVLRVIAGTWNHNRIRDYIQARGGRVLSIAWEPFGPGSFGERSSAVYRVLYVDRLGVRRNAHCKTGLFTGVYFMENIIAQPPPVIQKPAVRDPKTMPVNTEPANEANSELERLVDQNQAARDLHDQRRESAKEKNAAFEQLLNREAEVLTPDPPPSPEAMNAALDSLVKQSPPDPKIKTLEEENRRLRRELEELKRKRSTRSDGDSHYNRDPR